MQGEGTVLQKAIGSFRRAPLHGGAAGSTHDYRGPGCISGLAMFWWRQVDRERLNLLMIIVVLDVFLG